MGLGFELNEQEAQPVLSIRTRTPYDKLPVVIGDSYRKIAEYLAEMGEQPLCAPYTAYHNLNMQNLDVEIGFPLLKPLLGKNEIKQGEVPRGWYVSCMYKGPYSQINRVYNEIFKVMKHNGHKKTGVSYEYYYNSPGKVPENELLTRIVLPLK